MEHKKVKLVEIGPRDGFQSVKDFIPTEYKLRSSTGWPPRATAKFSAPPSSAPTPFPR